MKPNVPLWTIPEDDERLATALDKRNESRRDALLALAGDAKFNADGIGSWPGAGLVKRLREWGSQIAATKGDLASSFADSIDRFLLTCDSEDEDAGCALLRQVAARLVENLREVAQTGWLDVAAALLLGKFNAKKGAWEGAGALLFGSADATVPVYHPRVAASVTDALTHAAQAEDSDQNVGVCALTGEHARLVTLSFPQPNPPVVGQTYLYAKNKDIPAGARYSMNSAAAMPVGEEMTMRLAAALTELTQKERKGSTWPRSLANLPSKPIFCSHS